MVVLQFVSVSFYQSTIIPKLKIHNIIFNQLYYLNHSTYIQPSSLVIRSLPLDKPLTFSLGFISGNLQTWVAYAKNTVYILHVFDSCNMGIRLSPSACKCIYFKQITRALFTTNIFHLGDSPANVGNCIYMEPCKFWVLDVKNYTPYPSVLFTIVFH